MRYMVVTLPLTKQDHDAIMAAVEQGGAIEIFVISDPIPNEATDLPAEPDLG